MARLILLNKPFHVMCQFTDMEGRDTLSNYINIKGVYPAGRLDYDSEGLVLLTDEGELQNQISNPRHKLKKHYWVQIEGNISVDMLEILTEGVELKDGLTKPAQAKTIEPPTNIWPRTPPIRQRKNKPTSWIELVISEGKNRQVRRMTAAVGHSTLRLIRYQIGNWSLDDLRPGQSRQEIIHKSKNRRERKVHTNQNKLID